MSIIKTLKTKRDIKRARKSRHKAFLKHFGPEQLKELKSMTGWDLGHPDYIKRGLNDDWLHKIAEVKPGGVRLISMLNTLRFLYESNMDGMPFSDEEKKQLLDHINPMIGQMKKRSAYDYIVDYSLGIEHKFNLPAFLSGLNGYQEQLDSLHREQMLKSSASGSNDLN